MKRAHVLNKKLFMAVLILLVGLFTYGCGGDEAGVNGEGDINGENGTGEVSNGEQSGSKEAVDEFDAWFNPDDIMEVIALFEEFEYTGSFSGAGSTIYYRYEGTETVDGVETEKVTVHNIFIYWLDGDGNVVQAAHQFDDNLYPEDEIQDIASHLEDILYPFKRSTADFNYLDNPGEALVDERQETIGGGATVYTYQVDDGVKSETYEVADFGDLQLLLSLESVSAAGTVHNYFESLAFR